MKVSVSLWELLCGVFTNMSATADYGCNVYGSWEKLC